MNRLRMGAAELIGTPYRRGATGPHEFDCLGLMEYVFRVYRNVELPVSRIRLGEVGNEAEIKDAARASGLRPVFDMAQEGDLMLMENPEGAHVGLVLQSNSKLNLLHAVDGIGVCLSQLTDLSLMGFKNFRSWRLASER